MTVVALATVTTGAAAATALTSSAATQKPAAPAAKPTICVALIVDGRSIGSDVSTSCAKVTKGSTGVEVLEAGGHRVGFRNDGLLCTIDGLPKSGCASVNDTHYWAYFHRAPGASKWVYSSEGSSTYEPVNDSTEGWVYDNGKALTPENVPYAQICKTEASPKPSTTPTPHPTAIAASTAAATPTPHPSTSPFARHHSKPAHHSARPTGATAVATSPSPSTTSAALAGAVPPPSNHHGWLGLLIGLAVVLLLGVAAAVRFRRSAR
jgi:hypothetical protein